VLVTAVAMLAMAAVVDKVAEMLVEAMEAAAMARRFFGRRWREQQRSR
jgi:hypothetical protein